MRDTKCNIHIQSHIEHEWVLVAVKAYLQGIEGFTGDTEYGLQLKNGIRILRHVLDTEKQYIRVHFCFSLVETQVSVSEVPK